MVLCVNKLGLSGLKRIVRLDIRLVFTCLGFLSMSFFLQSGPATWWGPAMLRGKLANSLLAALPSL